MHREMLAQVPENGKNTFLITHKPNIIDVLGKDWFDVKKAKRRFSNPRVASINWWRACRWRIGRSSPLQSSNPQGGF
jgi:hypothetical protein